MGATGFCSAVLGPASCPLAHGNPPDLIIRESCATQPKCGVFKTHSICLRLSLALEAPQGTWTSSASQPEDTGLCPLPAGCAPVGP